MRNRKMGAGDDFTFCSGKTRIMVDTPEAVAQAALTRMRLYTGEWFLDTREGLDKSLILGYGTQGTRDAVVQQRMQGTPGVLRILEYSSSVGGARDFRVTATLDTIYGEAIIETSF